MSKLFRSAIGGFKKSDVNNYIVAQNREFDEKKAGLEDEITSLNLKIKSVTDKLALAETDLIIARAKNEELEDISLRFDTLNEKYISLESENTALKEAQLKLDNENAILRGKLAEAESTAVDAAELHAEISRLTEEIALRNKKEDSEERPILSEAVLCDSDKDIFSDALANAIISEVILKINSASPKEKVILRRDRILDAFKKNLAEAKARLLNGTKK